MKYVFIAFILFTCNVYQKEKLPISTETLDTIKIEHANIVAAPVLFETAFITGTKQKGNNGTLDLYGIIIGKIKIVSGHIIACDPLHIDEYGIPYTQLFPNGEFPVQLSIAKLGDEEAIAFARINFSDEPVARWEQALLKGEEPLRVGGEKIHGFSVDAGVAIYVDAEACKALDAKKLWEQESKSDLFKSMEKHYHNKWKYTMYNFGNSNLAAFSTGAGDGHYATYIGFDSAGKPCRLLTDFNLCDWKIK